MDKKEVRSKEVRSKGQGYSLLVTSINGVNSLGLSDKKIPIVNISRGGFCFVTDVEFEVEDRLNINLSFPDNSVKVVLGRICYSESVSQGEKPTSQHAYGFSVLSGFYELIND